MYSLNRTIRDCGLFLKVCFDMITIGVCGVDRSEVGGIMRVLLNVSRFKENGPHLRESKSETKRIEACMFITWGSLGV